MSEEIFNQPVDQVESAQIVETNTPIEDYKAQRRAEELGVKSQVKEVETKEVESVEEVEEKEYKPWDETEEKKEEVEEEDEDLVVVDSENKVPLHKLLKLKAKQKAKDAEIERYKSQLAEYETKLKTTLPKEEVDIILDPFEKKLKELGPEPSSLDFDDWDKLKEATNKWKSEVAKIEREKTINEALSAYKQEELSKKQEEIIKEKSNQFVERIEQASKTNPDIKSAIGWFEKKIIDNGGLEALSKEVQMALTLDENAPELIYRVVKDKSLISSIFEKSDDIGSILKKIGKHSAYIELEKEVETEETNTRTTQTKKNVPRTVSGSSTSHMSSSNAKDVTEYKKLRALEEKAKKNKR